MESLQKGTLLTRHPGALLPAIQTTAPTTMVMMNRVLRTHEGGKNGRSASGWWGWAKGETFIACATRGDSPAHNVGQHKREVELLVGVAGRDRDRREDVGRAVAKREQRDAGNVGPEAQQLRQVV